MPAVRLCVVVWYVLSIQLVLLFLAMTVLLPMKSILDLIYLTGATLHYLVSLVVLVTLVLMVPILVIQWVLSVFLG
jgi:hypothetical protein